METGTSSGFLDYFSDLEDPRIDRKKFYSVSEILLIALLAVISGAEGWEDMEAFGRMKIDFLRKYLPYENGTPSDDTFRRFFRRVKPEEFNTRFIAWMKSIKIPERTVLSIDGKSSRHTFDRDSPMIHTISVFASGMRLVLAQKPVPEKSNEITAVPDLLEWLDVSGAIITMDAMGCQKSIAGKIIGQDADYILSLKGNQGTLLQDVKDVFEDKELLKESHVEEYQTVDGDHARLETRTCRVVSMPGALQKQHDWEGLRTIVEIESVRDIKGAATLEKRYYISSLPKDAKLLAGSIRGHWGIENGLHYILDVTFRDDDSRIRKGNAPKNMMVIKHAALNLLQSNKKKRESVKRLRKIAAWNETRLDEIFTQIL